MSLSTVGIEEIYHCIGYKKDVVAWAKDMDSDDDRWAIVRISPRKYGFTTQPHLVRNQDTIVAYKDSYCEAVWGELEHTSNS